MKTKPTVQPPSFHLYKKLPTELQKAVCDHFLAPGNPTSHAMWHPSRSEIDTGTIDSSTDSHEYRHYRARQLERDSARFKRVCTSLKAIKEMLPPPSTQN